MSSRASGPAQLEFAELDKNGQHRGGKRAGAGRHPNGPRAGMPHTPRAAINPRYPQHVTLRVASDVPSLRKARAYRAIRGALLCPLDRADFRIVHISIQRNHIHLLCEANDRLALARGLQSFQTSAARRLNNEISHERRKRRRGRVFSDRYHASSISSVRQTRNALAYVLNNWRRHRQDRRGGLYDGKVDSFSSGLWFPGWRERTQTETHIPHGYDPPRVCRPQTWLLAEGWKRAKPISVFEVPGPRAI